MKKILSLLIIFVVISVQAQEHAWVYFNNKQDVAEFLTNPLTVMSQRSLDRRATQGIELDESDAPITQIYVKQVENASGITVKATSKWMNAVHVLGSISNIESLSSLNFVDYIEFAADDLNTRNQNSAPLPSKFDFQETQNKTTYNYGGSSNQAHQIRVDYLHELNYTGSGMIIAVLDNGFPGVESFDTFDYINNNGQILGGYNFIERNENIYARGTHGLKVLSTIAGKKDGQLIGTAIDAQFYLFITEDNQSETPLEESYWVEAAERADELGVDVINTSLGYSTFDDSRYDYSYADMDGDTAFITRGADIAATKGMIVCNSAGNSGDDSWHYITAPADGDNVFTVGAVDGSGFITGFSSYGPTSDGQIKPDILAKGGSTTIIGSGGFITTGNGTSFSSPVMAGAVTCFWQANPGKTNFEIMQLIRESANLYSNPTNQEGYGIANFEIAFNNVVSVNDLNLENILIYPNPIINQINIQSKSILDNIEINIYNIIGSNVLTKKLQVSDNNTINFEKFNTGIYFLKLVNSKNESKIIKFIKK